MSPQPFWNTEVVPNFFKFLSEINLKHFQNGLGDILWTAWILKKLCYKIWFLFLAADRSVTDSVADAKEGLVVSCVDTVETYRQQVYVTYNLIQN